MKKATAYKRDERIFLHASSRTVAGVWILTAPVLVVDQNDPVHLGQAILDVLRASHEGVEHPTSWMGLFDPVLKLAGTGSWGAFAKAAKCVEIEFGTNRISLIPTKNLGPRDGFEPLPAKTEMSPPEGEPLGRALLSAFAAAA